jgi:serine/threonine-protein kinase
VIALAPQQELVNLAASIADGDPVDWDALEAAAENDHRRHVLRELRLIAGMAALHRSHAEEELPPFAEHPAVPGPSTAGPSTSNVHSTSDVTDAGSKAGAVPSSSLGTWGPFTLLERVGEGAFGEVFRARDALQRDVALKLLRAGRRTGDRTGTTISSRILHEGRIMARVRHTNVVSVYGAEEHDGRVGLSMEFVRGRTIEALLHTHGRFSAREAALTGRELCRALAATHAAGLIHRDVKARNVMREEGGRVVLMDFGAGQLCEQEQESTGRGVTGTPLYLAPELLQSGDATVRSDIYGLGVLLFYLVTRSYPVQAKTLDDLRLAHLRGDRQRLNDLRPELPDDFVRVIERAIQPDPQRRFASAGGMQDALSATLASDPWSDHGYVERRHGPAAAETPAASTSSALVPVRPAVDRRAPPSFGQRWWGPLVGSAFLLGALAAGVVTAFVWTRHGAAAPPASSNGGEGRTAAAPARPLRVAVRAAGLNGGDTFSSNVAEQLGHDLSALPNVRVIASAAVEALHDRPADAVLQSLDADAVLEVSGTQLDHLARCVVRIMRAGLEPVLVETPSMPANPLRPVTRQLALQSVARLNVSAAAWHPPQRSALPLNNPDAVRLFRKGEDLLDRNGRQDAIDAADAFRQATDLEPDFVLAYAKWAEALLLMYRHNTLSRAEVFPVAQDAIAQALQRDDQSADAYAVLADVFAEKDHDWERAETTFRKALALNPSLEYARIHFALMLAGRGHVDEAVTQILEAQGLNPRSSSLRGYAGATLLYARRYQEAAKLYESALQLDPQFTAATIGLCKSYTALKSKENGLHWCEEVTRTGAAERTFVESQLVQIYVDAGQLQLAREQLQRLLADYKARPTADTAFWLAAANGSLGQLDEAFTWLDRAIDGRSSRLVFARVDSRLDPMRGDARFAARAARLETMLP